MLECTDKQRPYGPTICLVWDKITLGKERKEDCPGIHWSFVEKTERQSWNACRPSRYCKLGEQARYISEWSFRLYYCNGQPLLVHFLIVFFHFSTNKTCLPFFVKTHAALGPSCIFPILIENCILDIPPSSVLA